MPNYVTETYRIEMRMVRSDGCVINEVTALQPSQRAEATKYWDLFEQAIVDVFEFNLFEKSLDK